ncbi:MAG: cyclic nucleotide-binding domain-containing protein [Ahrensia sp.]|nr:cyclic nucleotide-binding domain-containing protein [Ahrensia sp.]
MSLESDIRTLERVRLFEGFGAEHLRLLAFGAETKHFEEGEALYLQGDPADEAYVIVDGRVDLITDGAEDKAQSYGPSSLLGELALITPTHRPAKARAARKTVVLKLSRALFLRVLNEYPELAERLHERFSKSVREIVNRLDYVRTRLARADHL